MKTFLKKGRQSLDKLCRTLHCKALTNANTVSVLTGLSLITVGLVDVSMAQANIPDVPEWNQERIAIAASYLLTLIEGALGALVMITAGIGAIVAAAMGAYRAAVGMLVVAVGAFILRSLVALFFGDEFCGIDIDCEG